MDKEEAILKTIKENTGIKADSYSDAIINLWMTFDPTPAMKILQKATDEYAKQQAIGFAKWIDREGWRQTVGNNPVWLNKNLQGKSTEQLYSLYITQQIK